MSEVFEGVVIPLRVGEPSTTIEGIVSDLPLTTMRVTPDAVVLFRTDPRVAAAFSPGIDELAAEASMAVGHALAVRYDSRIGHRSAVLFRDGQSVRRFGEDDELFVPLDDDGEPIRTASPLGLGELDSNLEYETISNAIQQGLDALGVGAWRQLFQIITDIRPGSEDPDDSR